MRVHRLSRAAEEDPDLAAALICTPSSLHLEPATYLAERGVHLLIEKPLSHTLDGVDDLLAIVRTRGLVAVMGHSYRFHEGFLHLKGLLDAGSIGRIYHVSWLGGHYLPDWHPNTDYRSEYAARRDLGGGVLPTNMSHTFDSIRWLFGEIVEITGWAERLGDLEVDVEDSVFCMCRTDRGTIVQCQSDFLQRRPRNQMILVGSVGHIEADFIAHEIRTWSAGCEENLTRYEFDPNRRYMEEMRHFLEAVQQGDANGLSSLEDGKAALALIRRLRNREPVRVAEKGGA